MLSLIPRDHWEHKVSDLVSGLLAALSARKQGATLKLPGFGSCVPVSSGRAALVTALRALNLPVGARVGVPLYCCPVVFHAVTAAGCKVRFVDVDPSTFCMSPADLSAKSAGLDAMVAVHMFGNACDVASLQQCGRGKPVIEDCAQALGTKHGGLSVGSLGAFGIFSFRSGKYLSAGEGGALYSNCADAHHRAAELVAAMRAPGVAAECAHVLSFYLKSLLRSRPLYGVLGYGLWNAWNRNRDESAVSEIAASRIYKADFAVIARRLAVLDSAIEQQRRIAAFYSRALKLDSDMLCVERSGSYHNRYHYPITFPSSNHRDLIASYLLRQRIDSMKYLDDVVDVARTLYNYEGDCPVAERLSKRVLVIPGNYSLKKSDVERIAYHVNAGWADLSGGGKGRVAEAEAGPHVVSASRT